MRKQLSAFISLGICLAFSCVTAQAQTTFGLSVDGCRAGCGGAVPYTTVSLTREGSKVLVTESLNSTYTKEFVATGSPTFFVAKGVTLAERAAYGSGFFFWSDLQGGNGNTGSIVADTPRLMTPEPASMLLFGSGLLVLGGVLRRRKGKAVVR
jgi:hypothetical protein